MPAGLRCIRKHACAAAKKALSSAFSEGRRQTDADSAAQIKNACISILTQTLKQKKEQK